MNADPAQVGFSPDGSTLVVTERGTDSITSFTVGVDGLLGEPMSQPSSGPTPYGFAFTGGGTLVVTEAFRAEKGAAAASSYAVGGGSVTPIAASVGNGRSEICWAVVTNDDRYASRRTSPTAPCRGTASAWTASSRSRTPWQGPRSKG